MVTSPALNPKDLGCADAGVAAARLAALNAPAAIRIFKEALMSVLQYKPKPSSPLRDSKAVPLSKRLVSRTVPYAGRADDYDRAKIISAVKSCRSAALSACT